MEKYDIEDTRLPVFIFLNKKKDEILRLNGEVPKEKLIKIIEEHKDK